MSDNDYMVTQKEAADFLNVSTKSISRYRKRGLPYKLVLNPVTGKQEVRFRYADLERWDEGRQLLAAYPRDGEEPAAARAGAPTKPTEPGSDFLQDLLLAYKDQIELLREQLEDMREQLARRDRQIDDLMRLMVGLQLEYKPLQPATQNAAEADEAAASAPLQVTQGTDELYQAIELPLQLDPRRGPMPHAGQEPETPPPADGKKRFSREQLSASIGRLRQKGKSYEEIARGLNRINVATLSGLLQWTAYEVQTLLPPLVATPSQEPLAGNGG